MTKRQPIAEIINGGQATLLDLMREAPGRLSRVEMLAASGMKRTMLNRHLLELVECDLVDYAKASEMREEFSDKRGRTALLYTITRSGSRALARYKHRLDDADKEIVPPPKTNMFERSDYTPDSRAYYRNTGHKHIQSRGFQC